MNIFSLQNKNCILNLTKKNLRRVAESLYICLKTPDEVQSNASDNCINLHNVEILNLLDPEL